MKRDFYLPEKDRDYLDNLGLKYETLKSNGRQFVIIYDYFVNQDYYKIEKGGDNVDVLLLIPSGYPNSQIDMASFYPHLQRVDKKPIPNIHHFYNVKHRKWQTWSRHRSGLAVWDPEIDFIGTHMEYVESFLQKEVGLSDLPEKKSCRVKSSVITKEKSGIYILQTKKIEKLEGNVLDESAYKAKVKINLGKRK